MYPEVVELGKDMVYNTALGIVQNELDAEDITQDVFITLFEKISGFREESMLSTWLYKITIRKSLDHEKNKKREKNGGLLKRIFSITPEETPATFVHPGILLDNKERATILFSALKKIPQEQRIAFTLQKLEGLSNQEIAAVMDKSIYAIESLQARAKKSLREILKYYYEQQ